MWLDLSPDRVEPWALGSSNRLSCLCWNVHKLPGASTHKGLPLTFQHWLSHLSANTSFFFFFSTHIFSSFTSKGRGRKRNHTKSARVFIFTASTFWSLCHEVTPQSLSVSYLVNCFQVLSLILFNYWEGEILFLCLIPPSLQKNSFLDYYSFKRRNGIEFSRSADLGLKPNSML